MENNKKLPEGTEKSIESGLPINERRLLTEEERKLKSVVDNRNRKVAENAVPPDSWENQQKAYNDAWENNKNRELDDDM
ncbi:hypothetical protein EIB71_09915 [Kaistella daneshvariae]|uniref:Uncharacterized protein n=1 Tax=Kaistella daneshvariae TaxID=2487074 RepID=A0A3N0WZT6_9FLAO|nr:hypothetical protein [Kaistella daneshvariae]AZI67960.1 hypothetical protein EIB71_09915 [Kaistella daneshvariae]ROI10610.1 hypothetical protein EGI11_01555 [Kaistella daneshvariae]